MGGFGSGEWDRYGVKMTVEECRVLQVSKLVKDGLLSIGSTGTLYWENADTDEHLASASFSTFLRGGKRIFQLSYRWPDSDAVDIPIRLQTTYPNYGGVRWWFTCPLVAGDIPCNRRVGKLYLPPGARYYGCRHCHNLTYQSCRESHEVERRRQRWERLGIV